jgi:hypothetical protein
MSLKLDVALREIYFNVNGGYMSMEKLYQKEKEEGVPGVSRKNVREWLQTQNTYIIHKPSRKHYKTQRTYVDGTGAADSDGPCGYEQVQLQE